MTSHRRALAFTLVAFAVSVGALGAASLVSWARCDGDECSTDLAVGVFAIAPATLLLAFALLLLRLKAPLGVASRAFTAAAVGVVTTPLVVFLLQEPAAIAACIPAIALLTFLLLPAEPRLTWPAAAEAPPPAAHQFGTELLPSRPTVAHGSADAVPPAPQRSLDITRLAARAVTLHERAARLRLRPMLLPTLNGHRPDVRTPHDLVAMSSGWLDRPDDPDVHLPSPEEDEAAAHGPILARR